ncbi:MAG: cytochrome c-type biogenesis protein CcmH [Chloroflexota bacterium]
MRLNIAPKRLMLWMTFALLGVLLVAALPGFAQESGQPITFDQVNEIARQLYCPVCPNETLDTCQTQACIQWRDEIHDQLVSGESQQQIIDSFVRRYGDRVLGTPQDPALRTLSLATPFLIAGLALAFGVVTFMRWRGRSAPEPLTKPSETAVSDDYRDQLERDLQE